MRGSAVEKRLAFWLVLVPPLGLGALGLVMVATAGPRSGAAGLGAPAHFALRQAIGLGMAALLGVVVARAGAARVLRAAPALFVVALLATAAVFVPGIGVRAAGASRWLRLGPLSGSPAPFLIAAVGLLLAQRSRPDRRGNVAHPLALALALALLATLVLVAQPDFSAAAVALAVAVAALAAGGAAPRRLVPAALLLLLGLGVGASRFGYVGGRVHGFLAPERDRRGKGFEVLALARANAAAAAGGVGLGHGTARRHLSSRPATMCSRWSARSWGDRARSRCWAPGVRSGSAWRWRPPGRGASGARRRPRAASRCWRPRRSTSPSAGAGCRSSASPCRWSATTRR